MPSIISDSMSLEGWSFMKWLKGNWKMIKEAAKVIVPAAISWTVTNSPEYTFVITAGSKFLLDMGEYYVKEHSE